MSVILSFSVYSLNISNNLPVQSEYVPEITVFFLVCIFINLFAVFWFIQLNHFKSNDYFPEFYKAFAGSLQKLICIIFHTNKTTARINKKIAPINNSKVNDLQENREELKVFSEPNCEFCQFKESEKLSEKLIIQPKYKIVNLIYFSLILLSHVISNLIFFL
jgi:hypothetical protein